MLKLGDFTKVSQLLHQSILPETVFELLGDNLKSWVSRLIKSDLKVNTFDKLPQRVQEQITGQVHVGKDVQIGPGAYIEGPVYLADGAVIKHTAYVRGPCYIGPGSVVGHASEVKGSVLFDGAKAAHFAYVGDSILGQKVNLGAGTKIANLKLNRSEVSYKDPASSMRVATGLHKFGGVLGDFVQTGCNSVLSPGSLMYPETTIFPCSHFHGTLQK